MESRNAKSSPICSNRPEPVALPVYVPIQADAACTVHRGFVSLHDAAAAGELPEPARDADAPAEGLALSAVAATVVTNYQTCHENAEQLKALQDWIRQMR
jgi:hypothetical protein